MVALDSSPATTATVCTVSVSAIQPSMPATSWTSQPPGANWSKTPRRCGSGPSEFPRFDVLDLDGGAGEGVAGVAPLLHPQGAVGRVPESQSSGLVILHIGVLGGFLREQVIPGRDLLGYGIVALQGQGMVTVPSGPVEKEPTFFPSGS